MAHKNLKYDKEFTIKGPTQRGRLLEAQFRLYKIIYDEVKNETSKIYNVINEANEDIEILKIQNDSYPMGNLLMQAEVEMTAEKMFDGLSHSMHKLAKKVYKTVYENLTESWSDILGGSPNSPDDDLIEKEIYGTIDPWIESLKTKFFDNISSLFDDLLLETEGYVQKGFFEDVFENVKSSFSEVRKKVDTLIRNVVSRVQTIAQKIAFKAQRVEKYQIIFSGHPNACEKCEKMANEHFNVAGLVVGETAPPFHPNCGCTMIPYAPSVAKKDGSLWEQLVIAANIAFELLAQIKFLEYSPLYNWIKSSIWAAGTLFLESKGYDVAKELFTWGMYGSGKELPPRVKNMLIEELKNSHILKDKIKEYTKNGEDFNSGQTGIHFTPKEPNLHYSVQRAYLWLEGKKLDEKGNWQINVKLRDQYDFTQFRNSLAFTDLANNLGEAMQRNNMMTEFKTEVKFLHIFEGL